MDNNPFHFLPVGPKPPEEVYCLVEIPKGCSNKYEYDIDTSTFRLDRTLYGAVFYPTEYGIIPHAWSEKDNDPLDVMVFSSYPTFPGCIVVCRPIGALRLIDSGEEDNKIISVPRDDPRFNDIRSIADFPHHYKTEIINFWENYAELEPNKKIKVLGWNNKEIAHKIIFKAMAAYQNKFST